MNKDIKPSEMADKITKKLSGREPGLMDSRGSFAVLVPLVEQGGELCLLYEVRCRNMRRQPGEICFPGGKMEGRESVAECALRETREELGIPSEKIKLAGPTDFIALRNGTTMHPVVGFVESSALESLTLSPDEVAETFLVPVRYFLEHPAEVFSCELVPVPPEDFPYEKYSVPRDYHWLPGRESAPFYVFEGKVVWGLTGRITQHVLSFLGEN